MRKRILIDATTVSEKTDGLTQYIINLLKNFPPNSFEEYNFSVLVNKNVCNLELDELLESGKFKTVKSNIAAIGPKRDIDFFFFFMRNKNSFDLFHSTSNQYPLCLKNGIATVHDITFEIYFRQKWWTFNLAKYYLSLIVKQSLKNAKSVIAVSKHTKSSMVSNYKLTKKIEDKIEVIYEGWEHLIDDKPIRNNEKYVNDYGRYFFYVGTTKEHKNMKRLLEAYKIFHKNLKDINLILCGSDRYLTAAEIEIVCQINKHKKVVFFTGHVTAEKLRNLFSSAEAFIFPSLSEGFGIPVLETFYFEKPLLCSQTTSLPEIAGDAAVYFDPESAENISQAMVYFYDHPEISVKLVAKGKERLKEFSWRKAANETIGVYNGYFNKNKNIKILHLICTDGVSGAEKHLKYLLPGMASYGYECHLLIIHPSSSAGLLAMFADDLNGKAVKTTLIKTNTPLSLSILRKIHKYLIVFDINIIHSHLSRSDILAVLLKQFFCKQLYLISTKHGYQESILTHYDPDNFKAPKNLYYYVTKFCLSKIDNNISISNCISQLFINFNLTKEFYKVIYHGVDVVIEEKELEKFESSGPKLIIVGRLEPYKGHKYVIDAMKIVIAKISDATLFILGDGSYKEKLQSLAIENGISKNIRFLGFQKNAIGYMSKSDLVIIPSLFEPFGLVFIEAVGLKKCIIAFDVPAGNEILNNKVAQLVPKADVNLLAEKIIDMLSNDYKRKEIENKTYPFYLENYTTAIMIKKTAEHYHSLNIPNN